MAIKTGSYYTNGDGVTTRIAVLDMWEDLTDTAKNDQANHLAELVGKDYKVLTATGTMIIMVKREYPPEENPDIPF